MSRKKKPAYGIGEIVEGEILPVWKIDCSSWIGDTPIEKWTCGPLQVVPAGDLPVPKKRRTGTTRKKGTKR